MIVGVKCVVVPVRRLQPQERGQQPTPEADGQPADVDHALRSSETRT